MMDRKTAALTRDNKKSSEREQKKRELEGKKKKT